MTEENRRRAAGAAAGLVNGIFGGGGGMLLLPLLTRFCGLRRRDAFATCVAVIWPMCLISAAVYCLRLRPDPALVAPYLAGGTLGGILSGLTLGKIPVRVLRAIFGAFLIFGGVRFLL